MPNKEDYLEPCAYCRSTVNVSLQVDPYELAIRGRVNCVHICERCYEYRLEAAQEEEEV